MRSRRTRFLYTFNIKGGRFGSQKGKNCLIGSETRSYLKNRKIVRGQGRRRIVTGGIYVNISRITIQAGRRDRAIWHF